MDYELRIIVEKVAITSQEVIKRDTITSYALQCPASIVELGLRHAEQIALLARVQNIILAEQSGLLNLGTHVCPACGNPLKKNHIPPDFVVKSQVIDVAEVILALIKQPNVVSTLWRNRQSRRERLSTSEAHGSTTKSGEM